MIVLANPVNIRCPNCKNYIHIEEVLVLTNFSLVVNGECCGRKITSGEIPIVSLICRIKLTIPSAFSVGRLSATVATANHPSRIVRKPAIRMCTNAM